MAQYISPCFAVNGQSYANVYFVEVQMLYRPSLGLCFPQNHAVLLHRPQEDWQQVWFLKPLRALHNREWIAEG